MQNYVVVPRETFFRFTKNIQNKEIIDSSGTIIGKIDDLVLGSIENDSHIEGIVSQKTFIPWSGISGLGEYTMLNKRLIEFTEHVLDASKILLCKQLLDEQLVNEEGSHIGRVDDIALVYSNKERLLKVSGICTGIQIRMGIEKNYNIIPWENVIGFKQRPNALVVKPDNARYSQTSKAMIYLRD